MKLRPCAMCTSGGVPLTIPSSACLLAGHSRRSPPDASLLTTRLPMALSVVALWYGSTRKLYGLEKPKRSPQSKREMPFRAHCRHQVCSVEVRYIDKEPRPGHVAPVYPISILANYSRAVLASKVSPTQNQWDYLVRRVG